MSFRGLIIKLRSLPLELPSIVIICEDDSADGSRPAPASGFMNPRVAPASGWLFIPRLRSGNGIIPKYL